MQLKLYIYAKLVQGICKSMKKVTISLTYNAKYNANARETVVALYNYSHRDKKSEGFF